MIRIEDMIYSSKISENSGTESKGRAISERGFQKFRKLLRDQTGNHLMENSSNSGKETK